jgi:hypothetical protein
LHSKIFISNLLLCLLCASLLALGSLPLQAQTQGGADFSQKPSPSYEILESRTCQKDLQVRLILVRKQRTKFTTIFYKQNEELISGYFSDLETALKAVEDIQKSLTDIGWNCRSTQAEYLPL